VIDTSDWFAEQSRIGRGRVDRDGRGLGGRSRHLHGDHQRLAERPRGACRGLSAMAFLTLPGPSHRNARGHRSTTEHPNRHRGLALCALFRRLKRHPERIGKASVRRSREAYQSVCRSRTAGAGSRLPGTDRPPGEADRVQTRRFVADAVDERFELIPLKRSRLSRVNEFDDDTMLLNVGDPKALVGYRCDEQRIVFKCPTLIE